MQNTEDGFLGQGWTLKMAACPGAVLASEAALRQLDNGGWEAQECNQNVGIWEKINKGRKEE